MPKPTTVLINGVPYHPVPIAARLLGTTPAKIRALMGDGTLEWKQTKENGAIVVSAASVWQIIDERRGAAKARQR